MKRSPGKKPLFATIRDKVSDILSGTNGKIMFNSAQPHNTLLDEDYELYIEDYFNQRLCFERKRTERSKNPFLMMLLNIEEFEINKNIIIRDITSALLSSTRETDIKGWYRHDFIIGVIFTEISNLDMDSIEQKILSKLYDTVGSSEDVNKIKISIHLFPEKDNDRRSDSLPDLRLYPDVTAQSIEKKDKLILKRVIDVVGCLTGFLIFSPFFIIIPLIIKLTSKGPILFNQDRIGLNGEKFKMLKFRSMYINNNPRIHQEYVQKLINGNKNKDDNKNGLGENGVYKIMNDPRVTPIGRFLRKTSLDELPQFINVLIGNMSLVGPRPPLEYELVNYDIWHRRRIFSVKPGITGLWQVKGRSITTFDEMVRMDLKYTKEQSLWLDFVLLLQTVRVVLNGKGAY